MLKIPSGSGSYRHLGLANQTIGWLAVQVTVGKRKRKKNSLLRTEDGSLGNRDKWWFQKERGRRKNLSFLENEERERGKYFPSNL